MAVRFNIPSDDEIISEEVYFGKKPVRFTPKGWLLCYAPEFQLALVGGYGCVAGDTLINDPVMNRTQRIDEMSEPGFVWALSKTNQPVIAPRTASFCKGRRKLYRVETTLGSIVVTEGHRFLAPSGAWLRLSQLRSGQRLLGCGESHLQSIEVSCPSIHGEDALNYSERLQDSQLDYPAGRRFYDEPLHSPTALGLNLLPSHTDVPISVRVPSEDSEFLDTLNGLSSCRTDRNNYALRGLLRPRASGAARQNVGEFDERSLRKSQYALQSPGTTVLEHTGESLHPGQCRDDRSWRGGLLWNSCLSIAEIKSIEDVGDGEYYDIHVPFYENYWANGLWHHNSGKTHPSICRATRLATWYPGNLGLLGRFASTDLAGTTRHDALEFWREGNLLEDFKEKHSEYKVPTATLRCVNPYTQEILKNKYSEVIFVHLDDPQHIHGYHLGFGGIDEANQCKKAAWDKLASRLRRPGFEGKYSMWATSNTDQGYDWIYDYFFNDETLVTLKPEQIAKRRGMVITTYENRHNLPAGYIENMESTYSERMRKVLLNGSYDSFEGQMYEEWNENVHVFKMAECFPQGIPSNWNRILAVDPGGTDPWAWEFAAVDPWGNVIVYDEIYEKGTRVKPFAETALPKMRDPQGKPYRFQAKVIDSENKIAAGELAEYGITFTNAQKQNKTGDSNSSYFRLCGYLHPNEKHAFPDWHPMRGQAGSPRFFVSDRCKFLRKEMPQQRWKRVRGEDRMVNEPDDSVPNHGVDCALYMIRELPHPTKLETTLISSLPSDMSMMGKIMNFERRFAKEQDRKNRWNAQMSSTRWARRKTNLRGLA